MKSPPRRQIRYVRTSSLKEHPQAKRVPEMRTSEYADLLADVIAERAIKVPLEVRGNVVLDGRHRLRAAREAGIEFVPVVDVPDDVDPVLVLLKAAVLRRHLTDDQRALLAARFLRDNPRPRGGDRRSGRAINQAHVGQIDPTPGRSSAALAAAVSSARVKKATALLNADDKLAAKVHAGEMKLSEAVRTVTRQQQLRRVETTRPPEGTYTTIVLDPAWSYDDAGCRGAAAHEYPTMSVEEIAALHIGKLAGPEAHLYLWCTAPLLPDAFRVLLAWGFAYKTTLVWRKPKLGLGRYFRSQTEFVLFATRGSLPLKANNISNVLEAPQGRHSEKPEAFFDMVERASPGPYLEMFARRQRAGWTCWGAEADSEPGIHGTPPDIKTSEVSP